MAGNLNKVFLLGNLTRDPELRHTAQGTSVANFSIAVNRTYKGNDGDFKKETSYFNIIVWGKTGENCAKFLTKGRPVLVEGLFNLSLDIDIEYPLLVFQPEAAETTNDSSLSELFLVICNHVMVSVR